MSQNQRLAVAPRAHRISAKQAVAIAAILAGASDTEAAARAGCRRETISRWRHGHAGFVAELNRRRADLWEAGRSALRSLLPRAVEAISAALEAEAPTVRLRAAALVMETLAVGSEPFRPGTGLVDPAAVEAMWEQGRRLRQDQAAIARDLGWFRESVEGTR
jgi:hypothetical protein